MAGSRESSLMPAIKCSLCGNDVEISRMGDHICGGAPVDKSAATAPTPPTDGLGGAFASLKQTVFGFGGRTAPPTVDTSSANQLNKPDQLTPPSTAPALRNTTPQTPPMRAGAGFATVQSPSPAPSSSITPSQERPAGGYGGLGEPPAHGGGGSAGPPVKKSAPSLLEKLSNMVPGPSPPPGPFEPKRKPTARNEFAPKPSMDKAGDGSGRGRLADRAFSSNGGGELGPSRPRSPRHEGYGGLGPPGEERQDYAAPTLPPSGERAETFPASFQQDSTEAPARQLSAAGSRADRPRVSDDIIESSSAFKAPSPSPRRFVEPDTSRTPPPRTSLISPEKVRQGSASLNLADEFGVGNPYHSPSISLSSTSGGSHLSQLSHTSALSRSSQISYASSNTSPPGSTTSGRRPSGMAQSDGAMAELASPEASWHSRDLPPSRDWPPRKDRKDGQGSLGHGDYAATHDTRPLRSRSPPRSSPPIAGDFGMQRDRPRSPERRVPDRRPAMARSRGNCRACGDAITGKSVASADGGLSGRYHKACFVCTTCQEPFPTSTFYVLDDRPYCERHYHRLNGSLCGSCNTGIEGQYLQDESMQKYHVGCFRCGDCGQVLRDGYFDVNGLSYCERDAWKRTQRPIPPMPSAGGANFKGPRNGRPVGLPSGNRLAPPGPRARMEKRMTRLGMM